MTDKITREEAERALEKAIEMCDVLVASNTPGMASISAAILRRCRIVEPGGLDAEIAAAEMMDWQQVVANGGPPCFHIGESGIFCGRAERWGGHHRGIAHEYVSLAQMLRAIEKGE